MGRDKATLELDGRTLAARAAARLAEVVAEVLIADGGRGVVPAADAPPDGGPISITDGPGDGPAAGLLGAARERPGRPLLVLACDVPGVPPELLAHLLERLASDDAPDAVAPRSERGPEPLVAAYAPRALVQLAVRVATGKLAMRGLLESPELRVEWVEGEELRRFGDPAEMLANVNTPTDFRRLH